MNIIHNKSVIIKSIVTFAAVVAVVVCGALIKNFAGNKDNDVLDTNAIAMVSVDINPSVEVSVNKDRQIIKAESLNDDGTSVLNSLKLEGMSLDDGVDKIVTEAGNQGYITDGKRIVLVSAAMCKAETSQEYVTQLKSLLDSMQTNQDETNIMTLFIEDPEIISDAQKNNLSIGREFLYQYAQLKNSQLTVNDIRLGTLSDLLNKLNVIGPDGEIDPNIIDQPIDTTIKNYDDFKSDVKIEQTADGLKISWTKAPSKDGFKYYKVVASKLNTSPAYPKDGYLEVISDINTTSYTIKADAAYNGGDIGGKITANQKYYFSITYVTDDGNFNGNAVTGNLSGAQAETTVAATTTESTATTAATTAKPAVATEKPAVPAASEFNPSLSASVSGSDIYFSWDGCPATAYHNGSEYYSFKYYKVVASETNPNPVYPNDGYLTYICDIGNTSWSVNPSTQDYNKSPELIPGRTYYFSITYVYENGKISSNTVSLTVPASSTPTPTEPTPTPTEPAATEPASNSFVPTFSAAKSGSSINFSWKPCSTSVTYNGKTYGNFCYYKIVASETNPNPVYPADGYLTYITDTSTTSWTVTPSTGDYNHSPELVAGKSYYFSITYVFDNGKISVPGQKITVS